VANIGTLGFEGPFNGMLVFATLFFTKAPFRMTCALISSKAFTNRRDVESRSSPYLEYLYDPTS
jgi:hypothetical protein